MLGAVLLTSIGAAAQGVFYVDGGPAGSNSNSGTRQLPFATIQGAINITASLPNNNVTINVLPTPGGYTESVTIDRDLQLEGLVLDPDTPVVLRAVTTQDSAVTIVDSGASRISRSMTVKNFNIEESFAAILVQGMANGRGVSPEIAHNRIRTCAVGILVDCQNTFLNAPEGNLPLIRFNRIEGADNTIPTTGIRLATGGTIGDPMSPLLTTVKSNRVSGFDMGLVILEENAQTLTSAHCNWIFGCETGVSIQGRMPVVEMSNETIANGAPFSGMNPVQGIEINTQLQGSVQIRNTILSLGNTATDLRVVSGPTTPSFVYSMSQDPALVNQSPTTNIMTPPTGVAFAPGGLHLTAGSLAVGAGSEASAVDMFFSPIRSDNVGAPRINDHSTANTLTSGIDMGASEFTEVALQIARASTSPAPVVASNEAPVWQDARLNNSLTVSATSNRQDFCVIFGNFASDTTYFQAPGPLSLVGYFLTNPVVSFSGLMVQVPNAPGSFTFSANTPPVANMAFDEIEIDWQAVCLRFDPSTAMIVGNTTRSVRQEFNQ
jgi:hypothetical protein